MIIIKIGGGKDINIEGIVNDLAEMKDKFIIVHGANALRDQLAQDLGYTKTVLTSVKGYTSVYSDEKLLDLMMMAYAGLKNKRIVELCLQQGINAVGLSGVDARCIQGRRNRGIRIQQGQKQKIVRDYSGKPEKVNKAFLETLIENGYVPILTSPIIDEHNVAINTENDDVVRVLQKAFQADTVISFIEAPGFLENPKDEKTLIESLSPSELEVRERQVEGRMKRKILSIRKLFEQGVKRVIISDGRCRRPVAEALLERGTVIQ